VTARFDTSDLLHRQRDDDAPRQRLSPSPAGFRPPRARAEAAERRGIDRPSTGAAPGPPGPPARAPAYEAAQALTVTFGKFHGLTLGEIAAVEPSYVAWLARAITRDPISSMRRASWRPPRLSRALPPSVPRPKRRTDGGPECHACARAGRRAFELDVRSRGKSSAGR